MNILAGILCTAALLLFSLPILRGIGSHMIFNVDAILIIFAGTAIALFLGFPLAKIVSAARDVAAAFHGGRGREELVKHILEIARTYRTANIRKLENLNLDDSFLRLGVDLLIGHSNASDIRRVMEREIAVRVINDNVSQNILRTVARIAPSLGLAGTVISLIKMFDNMKSIETLAPLMGVALMSTFYGVIISNLFALPLCAKLKERSVADESLMHLTIEGILSVQALEHPLEIEDRLMGKFTANELSTGREHMFAGSVKRVEQQT